MWFFLFVCFLIPMDIFLPDKQPWALYFLLPFYSLQGYLCMLEGTQTLEVQILQFKLNFESHLHHLLSVRFLSNSVKLSEF